MGDYERRSAAEERERAQRRAEARARAGVSTRGVEVVLEDPRTAIVNAAGRAITTTIEELMAAHGGSVATLALILEGVMLNAAWHLWANAEGTDPAEFRRAFAKLAGDAAHEVLEVTKETPPA